MMTEDERANLMAVETAFTILVEALDATGAASKTAIAERIRSTGTNLVMESALPLTQKVGRDLARIADRLR